jgi:hypothetical protein
MADLDQINVSTERYIRSNPALVDDVFQNDPLLAYLKLNTREPFEGGTLIQEGFMYTSLIGGPYGKGKTFDISEKQVEQAFQAVPKLYEVNVTLAKEDIQVFNKGPRAAFKLVDDRMTNAYMTMGANLGISQYLNGAGAFSLFLNGFAEICNDGVTAGWDGATYASYPSIGGIVRGAGGSVGQALNSVPFNVAGAIDYNVLEETYGDASYGNVEANLGVTTVLGYSFVKEKFQTQQRFNDTQDPAIGFNGMKFNSATLIKSRYAPGTGAGGASASQGIGTAGSTANVVAVAMITQGTTGAVVTYPAVTGETLWWINARKPYLNFYVTDDPEYAFGFTGFKPAQGNTKIAGQVLFAGNLTAHPRYHKQLFGITG